MDKYCGFPLELLDCDEGMERASAEQIEKWRAEIVKVLKAWGYGESSIKEVTEDVRAVRFTLDFKTAPTKEVKKICDALTIGLQTRNSVYCPPLDLFVEDVIVEIRKPNASAVRLGATLKDERYEELRKTGLIAPMGMNTENEKEYLNLDKSAHFLVGGATGTGKSVFIHSLILGLIYGYSPKEVRLALLDPKKVEFNGYRGVPHLLTQEPITDVNQGLNFLSWAVKEMERRYDAFSELTKEGARVYNLDEYNQAVGEEKKLPKIVVVIDELADYMVYRKKDTEDLLMRISQKSRASGIYLIVATQRPSVDVLTKTLRENFLARFVFWTATEQDSRLMISRRGAERLLGYGDCIFLKFLGAEAIRFQCAFVSQREVCSAVEYVKAHSEKTEFLEISSEPTKDKTREEAEEDLFRRALEYVVSNKVASISVLQRKFKLGYVKAGKIIEKMAELGYVSEFDGKARKVLITKEQFESKYGKF